MQLRDRLAELRRELRLTLRQLRDRIEERTGERLSISYLSELERDNAFPSVETLARVARGYDLTLQQLLAPVEILDDPAIPTTSEAGYPAGLRALRAQGRIDDDWAAALARIEFRGRRPETEAEWLAIHGVLRALLDPEARA